MAHLDVYAMPGGARRHFVVDVQANLLSELVTRVVVPLTKEGAVRSVAAKLNPVFSIEGQRQVMPTQAIAAVASRELREVAGSLQEQRETVLRALDLLLTGVW